MDEPVIVTVKELASWLDCSPQRIRRLAAEGTVKKLAHDRYDRDASITGMIKRLRDRVERQGVADPANLQASARLRAAKTALLTTRFEREAAELVDAHEARETWGQIKTGIEKMVRGLPGKISMAVDLTEHDRRMIEQLIEDDITDLMLERVFDIGRPIADDEDD